MLIDDNTSITINGNEKKNVLYCHQEKSWKTYNGRDTWRQSFVSKFGEFVWSSCVCCLCVVVFDAVSNIYVVGHHYVVHFHIKYEDEIYRKRNSWIIKLNQLIRWLILYVCIRQSCSRRIRYKTFCTDSADRGMIEYVDDDIIRNDRWFYFEIKFDRIYFEDVTSV